MSALVRRCAGQTVGQMTAAASSAPELYVEVRRDQPVDPDVGLVRVALLRRLAYEPVNRESAGRPGRTYA